MKLYFDCTSGVSSDMILNALTGLGADTGAAQRLRIEEEGHSPHSHGGHAHHHSHRSHREIRRLIEESELPQPVKDIMCSIYLVIARAEAKVHESDVENVHFHEVGRPQAIRNIAGIAAGLEDLGVQEILCSELHDGKGFIECSHGRIPVPVPAVMAMRETCDYVFATFRTWRPDGHRREIHGGHAPWQSCENRGGKGRQRHRKRRAESLFD